MDDYTYTYKTSSYTYPHNGPSPAIMSGHTLTDFPLQDPSPPDTQVRTEGVDELAELLNILPSDNHHIGIKIVGISGKSYSLIDLMIAQVKLMQELNLVIAFGDKNADSK